MIRTLRKKATSKDGWSHFYESEGHQWVLTHYHPESHGGGIPVLKKLPLLDVNQLIDLALTSTNKDDIIGASLELAERERYYGEDFREILMEKLSTIDVPKLSAFERERLILIIKNSELTDSTNRRSVDGKHWTDIQKDAEYFQHTSRQATEILSALEKHSL